MTTFERLACAALLMATAAPASAQAAPPPTTTMPATMGAPQADAEGKPLVVNGRHRHGVMRFFFGRNRRHGGFFKNLFHPHGGWQTTAGHRAHCKRHFRSYDPRTNSYRAYSGIRRKCVL